MVRVWLCHTQFGWIAAWSFTTRPHSLQPQPQPYFDLWLSLEAAGMARGCYGTMERPKKHLGFWVQDSTFLPHKFNFRVFAHKTCQIPETKTVPRFLERLAIRNSWVVSQAAKFSTTNTANSATDTAVPPVLWPPKQFRPAHDARRLPRGLPWARSPRGYAGEVHGARSYEMVRIKMWDPRIRRLWFSTKIYIIPYNWGYNPFTKWDDV